MSIHRSKSVVTIALALSLLLGGCFLRRATKPDTTLTDAEQAVLRAEQAHVGDYDATDLRHARENLAAARAAANATGEKDKTKERRSRWLAARAKVDAELGLARAEAIRLKAQTLAVQREIDERLATPTRTEH